MRVATVPVCVLALALACVSRESHGAPPSPSPIPWNGTTPVPCFDENSDETGCILSLRYCSLVKAEIAADVSAKLQSKIKGYYKGIDIDFAKSTDIPQGSPFPKPVCNPVEEELQENKLNPPESCGASAGFTLEGSDLFGVLSESQGTRDLAYAAGGWVAALKCHSLQVLQEVSTGTLKISAGCESFGKDVAVLYRKALGASWVFLQTIKQSVETFCQQPQIRKLPTEPVPELCQEQIKPDPDYQIMAKYRINVCLLAATRSALEAAFKDLTMCEIFSRAHASYSRDVLADNSPYRTGLKQDVVHVCADQAPPACSKTCKDKNTPDESTQCAKACFLSSLSRCYQERLPPFAAGFFKRLYPKDGKCAK